MIELVLRTGMGNDFEALMYSENWVFVHYLYRPSRTFSNDDIVGAVWRRFLA